MIQRAEGETKERCTRTRKQGWPFWREECGKMALLEVQKTVVERKPRVSTAVRQIQEKTCWEEGRGA